MQGNQTLKQMDRKATRAMGEAAIPMLRWSLAVTYIWFGALKVIGKSPVSDLVANTLFFLPSRFVVRAMGAWEILIGIGLLIRLPLRLSLLMLWAHLAGTMTTFLIRPQDTFQEDNPLLLTERGEFIIKNLVLASAGLAVGSMADKQEEAIRRLV